MLQEIRHSQWTPVICEALGERISNQICGNIDFAYPTIAEVAQPEGVHNHTVVAPTALTPLEGAQVSTMLASGLPGLRLLSLSAMTRSLACRPVALLEYLEIPTSNMRILHRSMGSYMAEPIASGLESKHTTLT